MTSVLDEETALDEEETALDEEETALDSGTISMMGGLEEAASFAIARSDSGSSSN